MNDFQIPDNAIAYQMFSRNNDINGNPYRLLLAYDSQGDVVLAIEERSSSPNFRSIFRDKPDMALLPGFHLTLNEYNATKKAFKDVLIHN